MTTLAINQADSWQFEDKRFYRLLWLGFALWLIFAVLVPALKVPAPSREVLEQLPPQLAKVVLEQRKAPPPPEPEPVEQNRNFRGATELIYDGVVGGRIVIAETPFGIPDIKAELGARHPFPG